MKLTNESELLMKSALTGSAMRTSKTVERRSSHLNPRRVLEAGGGDGEQARGFPSWPGPKGHTQAAYIFADYPHPLSSCSTAADHVQTLPLN